MKRIIKTCLICVLFSLMSFILVGCNMSISSEKTTLKTKTEMTTTTEKEYPIRLSTVYNGKTVDICDRVVRVFINAKDDEVRIASMLYEQLKKGTQSRVYADHQNINFSWDDTKLKEDYTLIFSSDNEFKNELFRYTTKNADVSELGIFIPGQTYYYKVVGSISGESKIDSFTVKDLPVRFISAGAILNMRDMGGWTTTSGEKVKYGLIYRGAALDGMEHPAGENYILERGTSRLDEMGLLVFNEYLKMKGEIDLRGVAEDQHQTPTFGGKKENICQVPEAAASILWSNPENQILKNAIREYFAFLADESNYPIYFHCNGGADRTGALGYLINGVLGVPYECLALDYELTSYSFAAGGIRKRSDINSDDSNNIYFEKPNDLNPAVAYCTKILLERYGDSKNDLAYAVEKYLLSCGVTSQEIESFKNIMLG